MVETATSTQKEPLIVVDESRAYKVNAGKCTYCGNYKTWEFKVQNPKTGKMVPGHVTAEGFKINDGDCPYFAAFRRKRAENQPVKARKEQMQEIQEKTTSPDIKRESASRNETSRTSDLDINGKRISVSRSGPHFLLQHGNITLSLRKGEATTLLKELVNLLI